jgi:hypothetical protein
MMFLTETFRVRYRSIVAFTYKLNCSTCHVSQDIDIPTGSDIGPLAKRMWDEISDIQYGRVEHPWSVVVK